MRLMKLTKIVDKKAEAEQQKIKTDYLNGQVPVFSTNVLIDTADVIGINATDLKFCLSERLNSHTRENKMILKDYIDRLNLTIPDEDFRDNLITKLIFIRDYGSYHQLLPLSDLLLY